MASVIEVEGLVKRYEALAAVDGIDFEVRAGEVFALLGPNGAGKTTTCEILETIRRKTAGRASVLGLDVDKRSDQIRQRIGVLPQEFDAYETLTCRENLRYFAAMFDARPDADALIARVGLEDKADARYGTLSGGLKRRLGIAISLVNDPEIVFLDEPTTGLDPHARRETWGVVQDLKAHGKTVFLTTHYMEEAQVLADRVAIMNRGRLVDIDTPNGLIRKHARGSTVLVRAADEALATRLGPGARMENGTTVVHAADEESLSRVLKAIAAGGRYEGLEVRSPTLEDVFLTLTGEKLDEGATEGGS